MNNEMPDQNQRKINWELFIVGLLLTTFSVYMSYAIFLSHQKQPDASVSYVPIMAKILESQISQTTTGNKTTTGETQTYIPLIHYEYEVNGQIYQSKKFNYSGKGFSRSRDAQRMIWYYPAGSTQSVYYNPDNPAEAVLSKSASTTVPLSIFIPVVFVLAGLVCIFGGWNGWLRAQRGSRS